MRRADAGAAYSPAYDRYRRAHLQVRAMRIRRDAAHATCKPRAWILIRNPAFPELPAAGGLFLIWTRIRIRRHPPLTILNRTPTQLNLRPKIRGRTGRCVTQFSRNKTD